MATYEVISGIPIPKVDRTHHNKRFRYPFENMPTGGMIFVTGKTTKAVSSYVSRATKNLEGKWVTRTIWLRKRKGRWEKCAADAPGATQGAGVWRVE